MGKGINEISVKRQSTINMVISTTIMERKSAMICINPSEKISLMLSISLIVLVVVFQLVYCQTA
jgi:hypothetical protein